MRLVRVHTVVGTESSQLGNAVLPRLAGWEEQTAPPRWGRARQRKPVHLLEGFDVRRDLIFKPAEETSTAKPGSPMPVGGERKEHHNGRVLSFRLSASHTL